MQDWNASRKYAHKIHMGFGGEGGEGNRSDGCRRAEHGQT
jgi:hypothetical protein